MPELEPLQHLRAVVFDFDGTLADSYPAITASVNHVRSWHGLMPLQEAEVRRHVGRGPVYLLQHTVPGTDVERDLARYREHHPSVMREGTRLLPGARAVLHSLHYAGLRLAVCSNKPRAFTRELLVYLGVAPWIAVLVGPEDVIHPKPAPDMLLAALAGLGVTAAETLYVGDMGVDIQTARQAGVVVWVVATGSETRATLEAARPDRLVRDLEELGGLLGVKPALGERPV